MARKAKIEHGDRGRQAGNARQTIKSLKLSKRPQKLDRELFKKVSGAWKDVGQQGFARECEVNSKLITTLKKENVPDRSQTVQFAKVLYTVFLGELEPESARLEAKRQLIRHGFESDELEDKLKRAVEAVDRKREYVSSDRIMESLHRNKRLAVQCIEWPPFVDSDGKASALLELLQCALKVLRPNWSIDTGIGKTTSTVSGSVENFSERRTRVDVVFGMGATAARVAQGMNVIPFYGLCERVRFASRIDSAVAWSRIKQQSFTSLIVVTDEMGEVFSRPRQYKDITPVQSLSPTKIVEAIQHLFADPKSSYAFLGEAILVREVARGLDRVLDGKEFSQRDDRRLESRKLKHMMIGDAIVGIDSKSRREEEDVRYPLGFVVREDSPDFSIKIGAAMQELLMNHTDIVADALSRVFKRYGDDLAWDWRTFNGDRGVLLAKKLRTYVENIFHDEGREDDWKPEGWDNADGNTESSGSKATGDSSRERADTI
ncbi:MAG TPA: hypothetical protein VFE47_14530 [Tepidisphaeraceae bacterium]|jgi:hypothetical protein|nr:hypothetical protein [Tepidisphaeraceae bacterium]